MANNKTKAQIQIDVSFVSNATKLVKDLQGGLKGLNLSSVLTKDLATGLNQGFKTLIGDLNKMSEGLGKKGLNPKQYQEFFNQMNTKIQQSTGFITRLGKELDNIYDSDANKQAIKSLEDYRKKLEDLKKISIEYNKTNTRQGTAAKKMFDETGVDYNVSKHTIRKIYNQRKEGKTNLTKGQQLWYDQNNLDETKLKRILDLYKQMEAYEQKIATMRTQSNALSGKSNIEQGVKSLEHQIGNTEKMVITVETYQQWQRVLHTMLPYMQQVAGLSNQLASDMSSELPRARKEAEDTAKAASTIKEILGQFGIVWSASTVVRGFQDLARSAYEFYKSLDSALNEIYVVSNLSSNAVNGLKSNFINMAKETGMALDDVTRSAVLFYQQGLNTEEVMEMTEVTSEFAKVAGIDATDAADKLTAAVNGYCLAAEDAALVADKFNKVAAASAADINELSTAFSKAAAQANQAGVGMDNYLAYIATMVEATREAPENIGTSLKTIMSRMQQVKEGGVTEDGESDINKVETALKSVNVRLRDSEGELRNLEDVLGELGPKWNSLNRNTQAYLGTIIAGTRQQSRFITLMQNWDRVLELSEDSANSAGQQALMHAKAMDSIASKAEQLQVAWQEFVSNLASSELFKGAISGLTKLLNLFNNGRKPLSLLTIGVALLSKKMNELQKPIANKITEMFGGKVKGEAGKLSFKNTAERDIALEENEEMLKVQMQITQEKHNQLLTAMRMKDLDAQALRDAQDEYNKEAETLEILRQQNNEIVNANIESQKWAKNASAVGSALMVAGAIVGQSDDNLGGLLNGLGGVSKGIGDIASSNYISGILSLVMGGYQLAETVVNWQENLNERMNNAVNETKNAVDNLSSAKLQENTTSELIDEYNDLSSRIHLTASEQERLNEVVQQLGDAHDIEVMEDAYGNLTINIEAAKEALSELVEERLKAARELEKQEVAGAKEATGGLFNNKTLTEYYEKMFRSSKASYRSLLNGVEDNLSDDSRRVSKNVAKEFSSNLETAILNEVESNPVARIKEGIGNSLMQIESDINNNIDDQGLNELYGRIAFIQDNIEEMSYDDVQESLENFYGTWSSKNDVTLEQWNMIKDAVNNTIFDNKNLLNFYKKVDDMGGKISGKFYDDKIAELEKQRQELANEMSWMEENRTADTAIGAGAGAAAGAAIGTAIAPGIGTIIGAIGGAIVGGVTEAALTNTEEAQKYELTKEQIEELKKQKEEYLKQLDQELELVHGIAEAEQWYNAQLQMSNMLKAMTTEEQSYLNGLESLFTTEDMTAQGAEDYAKSLKQALESDGFKSMDTDAERYNYLARFYEKNSDKMSKEVQAQWEEILDEAFNDLEIAVPKTLTEIANELTSLGGKLITMNEITSKFVENGGLALDEFTELAGIIDGIDLKALGQMGGNGIDAYIDAIDKLNLSYDENTGLITMNGEALDTLQNIQEVQTKSKLAGMIAELKASRATTETQLAYIDAQIAATEAAMAATQADAGSTVTADQIKGKANDEFNKLFDESMKNITKEYQNDITNQGKWSTAILSNIGKVADAWSKYFVALEEGSAESLQKLKQDAENTAKELTDSSTNSYACEGAGDYSGIDWSKYSTLTTGSEESKKLYNELETYLNKLKNTRKEYQATLDLTNKEIGLLEKLYNSDLSKFGLDGKGANKELEQYIGKLKEIYNILNRIGLLEHRLNTLDTYSDVAEGELYGEYLQNRVELTEELLRQHEFLVKEQKAFTNGYKDFIESSNLADVFDFDEYGQIIVDFEKYNALQDKAADGQKSMKEQADEMYETYTEMYEETQDYFDAYIDYLKKAIDLEQEKVDAYVNVEKKAADAIKEIYQDILDTQLEAIDKEIEALEDLQQAREQARKEQQDAKEVSGLQTSLQRAMFDTSGASDSAQIKARQDLNDKLDAMADDKYSEMLDNLKTQLEDQKEMLQEEFDEMFENLDWLYAMIETNFMNDEQAVRDLITQTDSWGQLTNAERKAELDSLSTDMNKYMTDIQNGKTIKDICDYIDSLQQKTIELDEALKTTISNTGIQVANAIANGIASAASGGGSGGGGKLTGGNKIYTSPTGDQTPDNNNVEDVTGLSDGTDDGKEKPLKMAENDKIEFRPKDDRYQQVSVYAEDGSIKGVFKNEWWTGDKNGIAGAIRTIKNQRMVYFKPADGFIPTTYFQVPGSWGERSTGKRYYLHGGLIDYTGPAWVDGSYSRPEAVLNALQTEHFIKFTNALDNMYGQMGGTANTNSIVIDTISFNVDSMSSAQDGEAAFDAFVNKFKEIGSQRGMKINNFKNIL